MAVVGTSAVATGTVAVLLVGGTYNRSAENDACVRQVIVNVTAGVAVRVGGSNVTATANGVLLAATTGTQTFWLQVGSDQLYAASASASTVDVVVTGQ